MTHGQEDYGMYSRKTTVFGLSDMAELAVRLGSIISHDRRGDVIWFDDFESGIAKWTTSPVGTGSSIVQSALAARNGGFSCKLTTGDSSGNTCQIVRVLPYPVLSKTGFEFSFTYNSDISEYRIYVYIYNGSAYKLADVKYLPGTTSLQIQDNAAGYVEIDGSLTLYEGTHPFNTLKVVADPSSGDYVRLIMNETEHDISAYALVAAASGTAPGIWIAIKTTTGANSNEIVYIDDVIVTQNEP